MSHVGGSPTPFIEQAEEAGILVMVSGVVGSNNRAARLIRTSSAVSLWPTGWPHSFVFLNGADTKAAQMFTLAHELAHIWLGQSALSDTGPASSPVSGKCGSLV